MRTRLLSTLMILSLAGCATDELPTLSLVGFHGLKIEAEGCTYTEPQMSSSTYDVGIATLFGMPLNLYAHLRNDLIGHADPQSGQVESNRVEVRSMRVAFEGEDWAQLPKPIEIPITGVAIEPNGEHWKHLSPITPKEAEILAGQFSLGEGQVKNLRIRLTFHGETMDGSSVVSNSLSHLVHVCRGCVGCPPGFEAAPACSMSFAQPDGIVCEEAAEPEVPEDEGI